MVGARTAKGVRASRARLCSYGGGRETASFPVKVLRVRYHPCGPLTFHAPPRQIAKPPMRTDASLFRLQNAILKAPHNAL
jgi:hypothetical protein